MSTNPGDPGPCPHCGRVPSSCSLVTTWQDSRAVVCPGCGAQGPRVEVHDWSSEGYRAAEAEAVRRWNARVSLVAHQAGEPVQFHDRGLCDRCGDRAVVLSAVRDDGTRQTRCEACGHTVEFS